MELISIIPDFRPLRNDKLLARAAELTPPLIYDTVSDPLYWRGDYHSAPGLLALPASGLGRDAVLTLDFKKHRVGRFSLELSAEGSHPDAPAYLRLRFAETLNELGENAAAYGGWLSKSWIQEEFVHVDALPAALSLPRRYAFRYVQITVLDTSPKYKLVIKRAACRTETSAGRERIRPRSGADPRLDRIFDTSLRTLAGCMQQVFEDGPKRDRRLWLGDLRLTALTNYVSFRNNDLVKRCLYLFGGSRFPDGRVAACVFTEPEIEADDTFLFDYALMYVAALDEYIQETGDTEALDDLYGIAMEQIDYAAAQCGADGIVNARAAKDSFIDWCDGLDRTAPAQGVLIYALGYAISLARRKGDAARERQLARRRDDLRRAALEAFWNEEQGCFLSGGQASAASQLWMVLAGVPDPAQAERCMRAALRAKSWPRMGTPYLRHYFVMALLKAGLREEAGAELRSYWGGMLDAGADTFWECWDGAGESASPYGGHVVNSYCHAWSCTPAYIIARFLNPAGENGQSF